MEEDDIDYKFAYEQHFGAISSESGSENEEEFLRLYGNYEPLPVPIDPNNVIIVPPDELFKQFDQKNAVSSTGHIDEEGFIKVGVENMKSKKTARQSEFSNQSVAKDQKSISPQKKTSHQKLTKTHSPQSKKKNNKPPQTKFPVHSTSSNNISRPKEKKLSTNTYIPSLMGKEFDKSVINCVGTGKSTGAKKKKSKDKQNNVPFYTSFELIEDDFPALSSPTSNVGRPKKKMLPNECQIGPEINIPKVQEVSNTNLKYSAAIEGFWAMERSDYYPIINTTTNPILLEMMSNTNNDAVKTENELSYSVNCTPEYSRTDSDLFVQTEMESKNRYTTRDVGSFIFDNSKCSTTNIGTEKSTGAKKKKSKNEQNNVPFSVPSYTPFEFKEDDYYSIIDTTTNPILLEMMSNTNNDAVKTENEVSFSVNCTPEYIRTDSNLFVQKEMKSKNKDTTREAGSFFFDNSKSSITNIGTEKSTGAKRKKPKNKNNYVPITTTFKFKEDEFPALPSSTSNVNIPNQLQIEADINIPNFQEILYTNITDLEYGTVAKYLEFLNYSTGNSTTDSDPFMQNQMESKNDTINSVDNSKCYTTNLGTEKSTGTKKNKSRNKKQKNVKTSNTVEENKIETLENTLQLNKIRKEAFTEYYAEYIRTDSDLFVQNELKSENKHTINGVDNSKCSTTNIGTEKSTGAKKKKPKNKNNYVPITTTFKFKEDEFPALPSSTRNVNIPNQLQIEADINIPNDQEVLYTNLEYGTVAKFPEAEKISYPPPINTTTIPSLTEMQFDTSNNAVNHQNEVPHFINYSTGNSTTDSDPFMQNQMESKNKDTINGVDNSKCSTTNLGTEKSTGSKKKKSRNKKQKNVETSNTVEENKIESFKNTLQLNRIKKEAFTGYSSMHKIFQGSENIMTRRLMGLIHTRVLDFLTLPSTSSNTSVSVHSGRIPKNIVKTAKTELQLINNMMKETSFNNLNYYGSYSNLKTEECVASYTATECKTLENIPQFNDLQKVIVAGTAPVAHDNEIRQNIELTEKNNQETNSIDNDKCFNAQVPKMFVKAAKTDLQLVNNMMQDDSFNNLNYYDSYSNLKADGYFARYTARECKTSKNISHLNEMQNVVIADPSAFTNEYEISRCVGSNLTKDNKLETNSIDNYICFSDPQVSRNIAKTTETELQLVNNMMQDDSFNNLNYYDSYSNLKAEESAASYTARDCKTPENFLRLNEMQNVVMAENLQIGKPKFDVSQDNECVQKLHKRKLKFKNNPVLDAINYAHIELEDNIAKNNMPYKRDCDTNMSIEELTTKVNSAAIVNIQDVGVNTDDQLTSTNVNMSRKTCDVGVNTYKLVIGKNVGVNTDDELTSRNVNMSRKTCDVGVNSSKLVTGENVGVNTDDELTSTNMNMSRKTCDVGVNTSKLVTGENVGVNTTQQQSFQTVDPNSNISILDIFDKFIKLTRCDNDMPASIQLALQLTIILLIINIFSSLILWALDNSILICLIILYGIHFFNS